MLAPVYSAPLQLAVARARYVAKMYPLPAPPKPRKRDYILVATQPLFPKAPVSEIIEDVAKAFGFTPAEIIGPLRFKALLRARFAAYHAVVQSRPDLSLTQIARRFGDRDHTAVTSALAKMDREGVPQPSTRLPAGGV